MISQTHFKSFHMKTLFLVKTAVLHLLDLSTALRQNINGFGIVLGALSAAARLRGSRWHYQFHLTVVYFTIITTTLRPNRLLHRVLNKTRRRFFWLTLQLIEFWNLPWDGTVVSFHFSFVNKAVDKKLKNGWKISWKINEIISWKSNQMKNQMEIDRKIHFLEFGFLRTEIRCVCKCRKFISSSFSNILKEIDQYLGYFLMPLSVRTNNSGDSRTVAGSYVGHNSSGRWRTNAILLFVTERGFNKYWKICSLSNLKQFKQVLLPCPKIFRIFFDTALS